MVFDLNHQWGCFVVVKDIVNCLTKQRSLCCLQRRSPLSGRLTTCLSLSYCLFRHTGHTGRECTVGPAWLCGRTSKQDSIRTYSLTPRPESRTVFTRFIIVGNVSQGDRLWYLQYCGSYLNAAHWSVTG